MELQQGSFHPVSFESIGWYRVWFRVKGIFLKNLFISFSAGLGLCWCTGFSLAVVSRGYAIVVVSGLLTVVACLFTVHGLQGTWASLLAACGLSSCGSQALWHRLNSCGTWAQLLLGIWDLPWSEIQVLSHWATREILGLILRQSTLMYRVWTGGRA